MGDKKKEVKKAEKQENKKKNKKEATVKKKKTIVFFKYPSKEKDYFIENVSMLLSSGMSITETLEIVGSEIKSKYFKEAIEEIIEKVNDGVSLWRALDDSKIFSGYFISLLRIGEESGRLAENFKIVAAQNNKDKIFKSKMKSAMMYPTFVLILAVVIGLAVSWFILPKLATVFTGLKMELPFITKILINTGVYLSNEGGWVIPLIAVAIGAIFYFLFVYKKTKYLGQLILFRIPGIKLIIRQVEVARFGFILGTMLDAGISIITAMHSLQQATNFSLYKKLYSHLEKKLGEGEDFQQAFSSYKNGKRLIPSAVQKMISSGQKSGSLSNILLKVSKTMEIKAEITTKNLSVILEPVMLVVIWVGVVGVALAVIMPIYSLVGGLNKDRDAISNQAPPPPVPVVSIDQQKKEMAKKLKEEKLAKITDEQKALIREDYRDLEILENSLGYLNVRKEAQSSAELIVTVKPGEIYEYLTTKDGWYQIIVDDKTLGWVSGDYVKEVDYEE